MRKLGIPVAALGLLVMGAGLDQSWSQSGGSDAAGSAAPATAAPGDTVTERVRNIVAKHLGIDAGKVTAGARFKEDLKADDLDVVELVMTFEEEFNIEIPDDDAEKFVRVVDVIRYLRSKNK